MAGGQSLFGYGSAVCFKSTSLLLFLDLNCLASSFFMTEEPALLAAPSPRIAELYAHSHRVRTLRIVEQAGALELHLLDPLDNACGVKDTMLPVLNQAARRIVSFASSAHRSHLHLLSAAAAAASKQAAAAAAATASSITSCQHSQQCCQCTAAASAVLPVHSWLPQLCTSCTAAAAVRIVHSESPGQCKRRTAAAAVHQAHPWWLSGAWSALLR